MGSVVLETSAGEIACELYWHEAPRTCKNFVDLVRSVRFPSWVVG